MLKKACIYLLTCNKTLERYIGSAHYLRRRFNEHLYWLKRGEHANYKLQALWDKHGETAFELTVLEYLQDPSVILVREQFWIDTLKPELNIAQFVEQPSKGLKRSAATIERMRRVRHEFHDRLTHEQKQELREKVKQGWRAWWDSLSEDEKLEARQRRSHPTSEAVKRILSIKSKANNARSRLGIHPTPETLEKMRQATQSRWDETKAEREAEKARKQAEFDAGREARELERIEKVRRANIGKKRTPEQKEHLRQVALAQQQDPAYRAKHKAAIVEKMKDPEVLRRLSEAHKGKKIPKAQREKIRAANTGLKRSEESKARLSAARKLWWAKKKAAEDKSTSG